MDMNVTIDQPDQTIRFEIKGIEPLAVMGLLREMMNAEPTVTPVSLDHPLELKNGPEGREVKYPSVKPLMEQVPETGRIPYGGPPAINRAKFTGMCQVNCPECGEQYQRKATTGSPVSCRNCNAALYPKVGPSGAFRAERLFIPYRKQTS